MSLSCFLVHGSLSKWQYMYMYKIWHGTYWTTQIYEVTFIGLNIFTLESEIKHLLHIRLAVSLHTAVTVTPTKTTTTTKSSQQYLI